MSELNLKKNEVIKGWAKYYLTAEVNSGFERLTAPAFSYGMSAILAKLYKEDEEEYKKALQRHLMFYNSEATWGSVIFGMTCALEEERAIMLQEGAGSEELEASADMISNLKVGTAGRNWRHHQSRDASSAAAIHVYSTGRRGELAGRCRTAADLGCCHNISCVYTCHKGLYTG